jgi:hypothetical protein
MKNYLYSISPEVWQVICDGVDFPKEDEQPTPDQLQKIHRNAQAITILTSSVDKEDVTPTFYKNKIFVHIGVHIKMHIKL